jgi:DNA mismatch repair protein MutH
MSHVLPAAPPTSEAELLANAEYIAGLTLAELAECVDLTVPASLQNAKGWVGQLIEQCLGATAASLPEPDFQHIGVELKSLPINRHGQPQESTYVCTVPLLDHTGLQWETSWVRRKLQRVLWVPVEADSNLSIAERRIGTALLWSPNPEQEAVLKQDWEELMDLIVTGRLAEISAHHGTWLQIRPKAANARALCTTFDDQGVPTETLPRGFYLRPGFTRTLLNQHYQNYAG